MMPPPDVTDSAPLGAIEVVGAQDEVSPPGEAAGGLAASLEAFERLALLLSLVGVF